MLGLSVEEVVVSGNGSQLILDIKYFSANPGEKIGIRGPSGAGKSTFLYTLCGLVAPRYGSVCWGNTDLLSLSVSDRDKFRHRFLGLIFQEPCLFEELSALENASLAASFVPFSERQDIRDRAELYLERFGLPKTGRKVVSFSGGERQRVAVARALAGNPSVILADEPTAALDQKNRNHLMDDLVRCTEQERKTLLMVSHDQEALARMDRVVELRDGVIAGSSSNLEGRGK